MSEQLNTSVSEISRRGFIKIAIALFNGLIALLLAIPGLGYLLTPVLRKTGEKWIPIGSRGKFTPGTPQKAEFTYITEADYTRQEKKAFVWVLLEQDNDDRLKVFSPVCSHMGCNVAWNAEEKLFVCPCHGGKYDIDGKVVAGPPPRPLQLLDVQIKNEQIVIKLPA